MCLSSSAKTLGRHVASAGEPVVSPPLLSPRASYTSSSASGFDPLPKAMLQEGSTMSGFSLKTWEQLFIPESKNSVPKYTEVHNKSVKKCTAQGTMKTRITVISGGRGTMRGSREWASSGLVAFYFLNWRFVYQFLFQCSLNHFEILMLQSIHSCC